MPARALSVGQARACAAAFGLISLTASALPAQAGDGLPDGYATERGLQEGVFWDPNFNPRVSFGMSGGQLDVVGREFVYDGIDGNRISQLDYVSHQVGIIGAYFGVEFTPWLSAAISGHIAVFGDSESNDYDWIDPISYDYGDWTHYSYSDDTNFDGMHRIDVSGRLELFRHPHFKLGALAGLRWDHFAWSAAGGGYIYSSTDPVTGERTGYRDLRGAFPAGELSLSLEQDYLTPYVGLAADANIGPVTLFGEVKYSQWAQLDLVDKHYLRGFQSRDSMDGGEMFSWRVGGSYGITEQIALTADFEHTQYGELVGRQRRICLAEDGTAVGDDVNCPVQVFDAGSQAADNGNHKYSIGLTYKFH